MNSTEIQEKINAYNAKKSGLKSKAWFRVLEVAYWLALTLSILIVLGLVSASEGDEFAILFWGAIIVYAIFSIAKKVGYYIIIGNLETIEPRFEDTLDSKLKKQQHD